MENKIALITGASRGLGRSAALHLAQAGFDIIFTWRTEEAAAASLLTELQEIGVRAAALQLDLSSNAALPAFVAQLSALLQEKWGRQQFDALLNNAGSGAHAAFADTSEAQFDAMLQVHFKSVFFLTQQVLPLLADGARILNVSSGLTRFSLPGYAAYAAMKGALEVLTRYLAKELGPRRIGVNILAPGAIATDFGGGAVRDNPQLNQFVAQQTALGRVGEADDIGRVAAQLLSQQAYWITGQRIEASGGMFL